jgi:hypothetical protein
LIIVVALLGIFLGTVYEASLVGLRAVNSTDEREDLRQELANALDRLTREARMARGVDTANVSQFQFDADFDGNGSSSGNERDIEYKLQSGSFVRGEQGGGSVTLVANTTSLEFDYRDVNDSDMTPPVTGSTKDSIRVVQATVTATRDQESISMAASVYLTNRE